MNSQKTHKNTLYPEDFNDDDKLNYDILFKQSKQLFPKMIGNEWWYMLKQKMGDTEPPTDDEIKELNNNLNLILFLYRTW